MPQSTFAEIGLQALPAAVFSVFVLVGDPLIVMAVMERMGCRRRTAFLAVLTVDQISEFSLIAAGMGLITLVGVVTFLVSTYMILYSAPLYARLAPYPGLFERRVPHRESGSDAPGDANVIDVMLMELGRYAAGRAVHDILLRAETGDSILAASRAGRVHYDPGPGERLAVIGSAGAGLCHGNLNEELRPQGDFCSIRRGGEEEA